MNERQVFHELRLHQDATLHHLAMGQRDDIVDHVVDRKAVLMQRRLFDQITNAPDDIARAIAGRNDLVERLPHLAEIGRVTLSHLSAA